MRVAVYRATWATFHPKVEKKTHALQKFLTLLEMELSDPKLIKFLIFFVIFRKNYIFKIALLKIIFSKLFPQKTHFQNHSAKKH